MMTPNVDVILNFTHLEMGIDDDVNAIYICCVLHRSFFSIIIIIII